MATVTRLRRGDRSNKESGMIFLHRSFLIPNRHNHHPPHLQPSPSQTHSILPRFGTRFRLVLSTIFTEAGMIGCHLTTAPIRPPTPLNPLAIHTHPLIPLAPTRRLQRTHHHMRLWTQVRVNPLHPCLWSRISSRKRTQCST